MLTKKKIPKRLFLVFLALLLAAWLCEYIGDTQEDRVRNAFYYITGDSIKSYNKITVDSSGIPYVDYFTENGVTPGRQYNATIVATHATELYHDLEKKTDSIKSIQFRNCIDWLARNISFRKGYGLYVFNWQQAWYPKVKTPFTSGLSSGCAIEAFTYAQQSYPAEDYLQYAKALLKGFYLPIDSGGFTYKEKQGWWYEEFADSNKQTPRILDGHIYAILGTRAYFQFTKDDSAKYVISQGLTALKQHLPDYDKYEDRVCYDIDCKPADWKYHTMLAGQMKQLWEITNDSLFFHYYRKWSRPLEKPYVYRIVKERNRSGIILYILMSAFLFILLSFGWRLFFNKKGDRSEHIH